MKRGAAVTWTVAGFAAGAVLGLVAWTRYRERHARSLFSPKARRRWAALSRLEDEATADGEVDTLGVLREYVAWERHPRLRRRGRAILDRLASPQD